MPYTPITPLPSVPNRSDEPEIFSDSADSFFTALPTLQEQINNSSAYIDGVAAVVDGDASAAAASASAASGFASDASGFADDSETSSIASASSANFKGSWSTLTGALNKPASVLHNGSYWQLLNNLANVTTSQPGVTADWAFVSGTRWQTQKTASFNAQPNSYWPILATGSSVDAQLVAMVAGEFVCIHNSADSTNTVKITNGIYAIKSRNNSITSADNIVLLAGQMAYLRCVSPTALEVVANG